MKTILITGVVGFITKKQLLEISEPLLKSGYSNNLLKI